MNSNTHFTGKSVLETVESGNENKEKIQLLTSVLDSAYFRQNRNLLRCKDESKRSEQVIRGSLDIASGLGKLPPTEHILESFCVDVIDQSENQILFNVTGVFYEVKPAAKAGAPMRKILRCFARTMLLIAPGTQILQENIIISNPTEPLIQVSFHPTNLLPPYFFNCLN